MPNKQFLHTSFFINNQKNKQLEWNYPRIKQQQQPSLKEKL